MIASCWPPYLVGDGCQFRDQSVVSCGHQASITEQGGRSLMGTKVTLGRLYQVATPSDVMLVPTPRPTRCISWSSSRSRTVVWSLCTRPPDIPAGPGPPPSLPRGAGPSGVGVARRDGQPPDDAATPVRRGAWPHR